MQMARVASRRSSAPLCDATTRMRERCTNALVRSMIFSWKLASPAPIHSSITRMSLDSAVVAANGRAQALSDAERATAAEQGREQRRRFLTPGTGYQPGNAQMFHGNN